MKQLKYNVQVIAFTCNLIGLSYKYFICTAASKSDVILATSFSHHHVITSRFNFSLVTQLADRVSIQNLFSQKWAVVFSVSRRSHFAKEFSFSKKASQKKIWYSFFVSAKNHKLCLLLMGPFVGKL